MITRDELEAAIWKMLGNYTKVPRVHHVSALLTDIDRYVAATLGEIDNYRRQCGPNRHAPPAIHWCDDFNVPACRRGGRMLNPLLSTSPGQVTCGACLRTRSFKEAA